jgi:cytochrome c
MKRIFILSFALATLIACGDDKGKGTDTGTTPKEGSSGTGVTENPDYKKGLALVASSDCFTCHKIDDKLAGPSYREIAAKYVGASEEVQEQMADRVINGSTGVWGTQVMIPHPTLSKEDARTMVKYVLLLNK